MMGLYVCDDCGVVENTSKANYWARNMKHNDSDKFIDLKGKALCSLCDPNIKKWHGRFPRRTEKERLRAGQTNFVNREQSDE